MPSPLSAATKLRAPSRRHPITSWSLEHIRKARDHQMHGYFELPVRMAEATRTNAPLFTAYHARIATQTSIKLVLSAAKVPGGVKALNAARGNIVCPQAVRLGITGTMVNHGIAVGVIRKQVVAMRDGSQGLRYTLEEWPLEYVQYNPVTLELWTIDSEGTMYTINHGDGTWVVFSKAALLPWTQDAALLPASLIWAASAGAISDWSGSTAAHGDPKVIGELPEGVPLGDGDVLSTDAFALLDMLTKIVCGESNAAVIPHGAKVDVLTNPSNAWQIFAELARNQESAAARVYTGSDAMLGTNTGAPGIDVESLFAVATTRIQGDLEALERGMYEGLCLPWARAHGYTDEQAPCQKYLVPDGDAEQRSEQEANAITRLTEAMLKMREAGLEVSDETVRVLAETFGTKSPMKLANVEDAPGQLDLTPSDVARVVQVKEARAAQNLPPFGDERDELTVGEMAAKEKIELERAMVEDPAELAEEDPDESGETDDSKPEAGPAPDAGRK